MKLQTPQRLDTLAELIGAEMIGPADHLTYGINEIHQVEAGDLTFSDVRKYFKKALASPASTLLLNERVEPPAGKAVLLSEDPFRDLNRLTRHFRPAAAIAASATPQLPASVQLGRNISFGQNVQIGERVQIGHNVVIGDHVTIGQDTILHANSTIYSYTQLGARCCVHAGAVLGGEAFYFKQRPEGAEKMYSCGRLLVGDAVEIGANTTIDRGVTGDTVIGAHTKIDNLVQIGHDTILGAHCILAALVGIAGVCEIGDRVKLWGQVGIPTDITIGDDAVLMARTAPTTDLAGGRIYLGTPAAPIKRTWRKWAILDRLPEMMPKLEKLFGAESASKS